MPKNTAVPVSKALNWLEPSSILFLEVNLEPESLGLKLELELGLELELELELELGLGLEFNLRLL